MNGENSPFGHGHHSQAAERTTVSENLSLAQIRSNPHQFFPEVVGSLLAEHEHPLPEIVTPLDVETVWRVPPWHPAPRGGCETP